jgi:hypothetical protein
VEGVLALQGQVSIKLIIHADGTATPVLMYFSLPGEFFNLTFLLIDLLKHSKRVSFILLISVHIASCA